MSKNFENLGHEYDTRMSAMHVSVSKHVLDKCFTLKLANHYYYEIIGYGKEEYEAIFNNKCDLFFSPNIEDWNKISAAVIKAVEQGEPRYECVCRMRHKDGSFIWTKIVCMFTDEKIDDYPVVYTVFSDITEIVEQQELRKELEEHSLMLKKVLDAAEKANRAKSDFLSRMSHGIRTPMIGMAALAKEYLDNREAVNDCLDKA